MNRIYLDANAACPPILSAQEKVQALLDVMGNPSSFHEEGQRLRAVLDEAREQVARALGAKEREIIFTSGASEANRLFVDALGLKFSKFSRAVKILMSPFEHPSLLKPMFKLAEEDWCELDIIPVDAWGKLLINQSELAAYDVVICCQAHNETGLLPDLALIAEHIAPECLLMSDVSQSLARLEMPLLRVDVMTSSAQKVGGFAGAGALVLRGHGRGLLPPWVGGGQERGFRPGTEPTLLIAAFGAAAQQVPSLRGAHRELQTVRDFFESQVKALFAVRVVGENLPRLPNTSAIIFLNQDPDALRIACDLVGLSVGFGSACSGLAPTRSFSLVKMGLTLEEEKCCVRFSFPPDFKPARIDAVLEKLQSVITQP